MDKRGAGHIIKKIVKITLLTLLGIIIAVPVLLYIPFVQNIAKNIAISQLEKSTGMDINLDYIRLKFPLRVELSGLSMIEATGDTLLSARQADLDVAFWPLFSGNISVTDAHLADASYRLNSPDSAVYMLARIDRFSTEGTNLKFNMERINVGRTLLDGADIYLVLKDTVTAEQPDTTPPSPMVICATDLEMRNVRFHMRMMPTIDSLDTFIPAARLLDGRIDMLAHTIDARSLSVDSITAAYFTPSEAVLADYPVRPDSLTATAPADDGTPPWAIRVSQIDITGRQATYATAGAVPAAGLDMSYLQADDITIRVDTFYSCGADLRVPLTRLSATERCGLALTASGLFAMDSTSMTASDFALSTPASALRLDALMGLEGSLTEDPDVPLRLKAGGNLAMSDVALAFPTLGTTLRDIPADAALQLVADISGSSGSLDINTLKAELPRMLSVKASGHVDSPMDFNRMAGKVDIDGRLNNIAFLKPMMLDAATAREVRLPAFAIKGSVDYSPGLIAGNIALTSGGGRAGAKGRWNRNSDGYDAALTIDRFPLQSFLPALGVADISATLDARGRGFDIYSPRTRATADINLEHLEYQGNIIEGITLQADLDSCRLNARIFSPVPSADLDAHLIATISKTACDWNLSGSVNHLDLKRFGLADSTMEGSLDLVTDGSYNLKSGDIDARLTVDRLNWMMGEDRLMTDRLQADLNSTDSISTASLSSGDLDIRLTTLCRIDTLLGRMTAVSAELSKQLDDKNIDVRRLQAAIPPLHLSLAAGSDNIASNYLRESSDITFRSASLSVSNDSLITILGAIDGLTAGQTRIDRLTIDANQHGKFLVYRLAMDNKPGTLDNFAHVNLSGFISEDKISAMFKQSDIKGRQGFFLGANAAISDSTVTLRFVPYTPTIAYKKWKINPDNRLSYNFRTTHFDANLRLSSDSSSLSLYTEHSPLFGTDTIHSGQEDVILRLDNIVLQEWLSISPFAPPIKGDIDADLRFRWNKDAITGNGTAKLNDLYYGRDRVGSFALDIDVANETRSRALRADFGLMVDGVKVITARGHINDSTRVNPFMLDFSMIHFPLRVLNPFIGKDVAQLSGMLNGRMDITGTMAEPQFNGFIDFDSTAVRLAMTGTDYRFSEVRIPVDSNVVHFNRFTIAGLNDNPLYIDGTVDARRLTDIRFDLALNARDMQIVNTNRPRGANIYGKAFIDLDATARGNLDFMAVNADLAILSGTNVTYVMTDATSTLTPQSNSDMVRFVSFADTTQVAKSDSIIRSSMALLLDARLSIQPGTTINVDLSTDGKNRVQVVGSGDFSYSMTPMNGDGRLTGRYTISSGFVRYTPQISTGSYSMAIMSEKNFKFQEGSYIAFNGDILNPTLNIHAVDRLKANVTQEGQNSRLVNFDIGLSVTNTLENMRVAFDLSTDDDITISNELQAMSPEQRANQAMNMLLYNQYTGPGTKANANLSGNPLYAFLASQLNSWAANNIRGVDITFGIDQYDTTTDGARATTTSYSYRVSKTLFNDRFKIVVGGNYSTDADADENLEQNLISDVSFEYMLNRSGSMYLRLFRHVGYESILEGEITETGVGFVMKRKLNTLRDLFRFAPPRPDKAPDTPTAAPAETPIKPDSDNDSETQK